MTTEVKEAKPLNAAQLIMSGATVADDSNTQQSWEDLEEIYKSCSEALVVANNSVVELFKIPGVIKHIPNQQETKISILGLDKDIKFFSEELKNIHKQHEGRAGLVTAQEDLGLCLEIFEKYHNFQTHYQGVIIPTVITLSEEVGKAAAAMRNAMDAEKALTDAQNPNVITEVTIKTEAYNQIPAAEETATEQTPVEPKETPNV